MSLSQLAEIGSFVSGVAILASLIFLYFQLRQINHQVRQAEKNQKSAIRQGRASRTVRIILAGTDPSLADAFTKEHSAPRIFLRHNSLNSAPPLGPYSSTARTRITNIRKDCSMKLASPDLSLE